MLLLISIWALAEAIVFFIVADVPIMALGIKAGWQKALVGAGIAAVFAAIGGVALLIWAKDNPFLAEAIMVALPGIDAALVEEVDIHFEDMGYLGMAIGSFTGVPYKLYALAASHYTAGVGTLALFALASILARLPRFALVALVAGWLGPKLVERFGVGPVWSGFAVCWTGFYLWYWSVMGF